MADTQEINESQKGIFFNFKKSQLSSQVSIERNAVFSLLKQVSLFLKSV